MQLQDLSYKVKTDYINLGDYKVHIELFSLENIYYPKEKSLIKHGNLYESNQIVFGETENVEGNISLEVHDIQNGYSIKAKASLDKDIRCLKIAFNNLPLGDLITLSSEDKKITEFGELYRYPEGWRAKSARHCPALRAPPPPATRLRRGRSGGDRHGPRGRIWFLRSVRMQ